MRWSLAQILDAAAPHLDARLAAPRQLACVRSLLGSLPAALSDWIYLEFRLRPRADRIDVIVRVDRAHMHMLAGGRWPCASAFARTWADPHAGWTRAVEGLWLEFDFDGAADSASREPHQPRFFVDFTRAIRTERSPDSWWRLACDAIAPLAPQIVPRAITDPLRRLLHALPPGASPLSVGLPPSATTSATSPGLRVCVIGLARSAVPSFLGAIGLAGHTRGLWDVLDGLLDSTGTSRIDIVDLDLTPDGPGRLAVELAFARKPQLRGRIEEQRLLDQLVTLDLADAASVDALRAWPGCEIARLPHVCWPALLVRRLNHVKLVFDGDRLAAVKAYPCVFHRFAPRIAPRLYSIDRALASAAAAPLT